MEDKKTVEEITEGRTIWNSDGTDGPCLICPPPVAAKSPYPTPEELRAEAQRIEQSAESVADLSEYPRVAKMACHEQTTALRKFADTLETETVPDKRPGMTGEERRQRRAAILRIRAARLQVKASERNRASHDIGSRIPFGQPILVGHHSERGHRRAIERMHKATSDSYQLGKHAEELERRANYVERRPTIQASDSDAVEQYKGKLETLTRERDHMKVTNAAWHSFRRNGNREKLHALGFDDHQIETLELKIAQAYSWERQPYAGWALTNIGARIRDIIKKLERLERDKATPERVVEGEGNGIRLEDSPVDNRIRLFFPGKPDQETRTTLKRNGFRWTPSLGCWQAYRNWGTQETAKTFVKGAEQ